MLLDNNKYLIIEDYFEDDIAQKIQKFLKSNEFPYYIQDKFNENEEVTEYTNIYFAHVLYLNSITSWFFPTIGSPFCDKIKPNKLLRMKVNLYHREKENVFGNFHRDLDHEPHMVAIWSANTNNGGTILKINNEEVFLKSVFNRMVFFNGDIEHCSVSQTDKNQRININIVYL